MSKIICETILESLKVFIQEDQTKYFFKSETETETTRAQLNMKLIDN